jgi:nucleophosmin 3
MSCLRFQVETMTITDTVKIPIVVLKSGELRQTKLDLEFADAPVTFKLIKGSLKQLLSLG